MKNILIHKSPNLQITHFVGNLSIDQVHEKAREILEPGQPYRIGTTEEIPEDRSFRTAWEIDDIHLDYTTEI
tara:strand:- start:348 stop:563 length:216 start_codon:yes stop_codon:yes gene_type:complete